MRRLGVIVSVVAALACGCSSPGHHASASSTHCLDLRKPANLAAVRRLPQPALRRYADACNLTYTKSCSGSQTVDPRTGKTSTDTLTCQVFDKHGKLVRTFTANSP